MDREDVIGEILEQLINQHGDEIRRAIVVTAKGVVTRGSRAHRGPSIMGSLPEPLEETELVLLAAVLYNLAEMLAFREDGDRLLIGYFMQGERYRRQNFLFRDGDGYISIMGAGPKAVLVLFQTVQVKLGLIWPECVNACKKIEERIPGEYPDIFVPAETTGVRECITRLLQRIGAK